MRLHVVPSTENITVAQQSKATIQPTRHIPKFKKIADKNGSVDTLDPAH